MSRRPAILIGFIALAYIAARLWRLTDSCLWFDEIFSIHAAEHSWSEIIPFVGKDLIHPPLFYLLLKLWIGIGGESLFWLRLFPVCASVLTLVPLWFLCRELKLRQITIVVVFGLFTVNGALIKYAQEVRMYSLLLFLSMMSVWLFSRYYFRGKSFWILVIVNILLVYTHYFGWFVVVSEIFLILIFQRIKILRTLLMLALTAVAFVPWTIALFKFAEPGSSIEQNIGWMQRPGVGKIFELIFDLVDPIYFQQSSADPAAFYPVTAPLLVIFIAAAVFYLITFREQPDKEKIYFLAVFAALPILLVFSLSWLLPVSIWGSRHLLIVFVPVILLIAIFLTELRPWLPQIIFLAAVALLSAVAFIFHLRTSPQSFSWCLWQNVYVDFSLYRRPNEKLYAFEDLAAYHLWFASRREGTANIVLVKDTGVPEDTAYFLPRGFDEVSVVDQNGIRDKWISLAFRTRELDFTKPPLSTIGAHGYEVTETIPLPAQDTIVYLIRARKP